MASPFTAGPGHIFVGWGSGNATSFAPGSFTSINTVQPRYLGTAEFTPYIDLNPGWKPVMNDLRGSLKPFDKSYQGQDALIVAGINRWNMPVYNNLRAFTAGAFPTAQVVGRDELGSIGTLAYTEQVAMMLWVTFPYAFFEPYLSLGMEKGYRFFGCTLEAPLKLDPLGTQPRKIAMAWYAGGLYNPTTGDFDVYDHNMDGLPPID